MKIDLKIASKVKGGIIASATFLFFVHLIYNWALSYKFLEISGGITKLSSGWTQFGGIDYAWTTPLYIPGCLVLNLLKILQENALITKICSSVGLIIILGASLISSWSISYVFFSAALRDKKLLGKYNHRLLLAICGWIWVYVPIEWTWVYQWTIVY
ncbi:MAG: hypothetical protein KJP07_19245 [Desulfatitalea sp.]|nr:hypothetical protein [Desulfatitalea sp.]